MIHNHQLKNFIVLSLCGLSLFTGCGGGSGSRGDIDSDHDGILNTVDVDDDNDGLIEISSVDQLDAIRNDLTGSSLSGDSTGCPSTGCNGYELVADLDFNTRPDFQSGQGWEPIGVDYGGFSANFDGNGYVIRNLTIYRPDTSGVGLFGEIDGKDHDPNTPIVIKNVVLDKVNITGGTVVGALVGQANDIYGKVTISNCSASGSVTGNYTSGSEDYIGGLVGINNGQGTTITNSNADVDVSNATGYGVGGLVGYAFNGSTISNSYATGTVTGFHAVGGLVGDVNYDYITNNRFTTPADVPVTISQSYATGAVKAADYHAGGLVGYLYHGYIDNTFATGAVSALDQLGGLVGQATNTKINHSYAVNGVEPVGQNPTYVGGFVGAGGDGANDVYEANYFANDASPTALKCIGDGTDKDGVCMGIAQKELEGPTTAPDTTTCTTSDLYCGWDPTNWDFGNDTQLPGLIIDGVVYRP